MSSTQLRRLNSYSEFRTQAGLNSVIAYVHSLTNPPLFFPAGLNVRQRARFIQKFGQGDWRVANNVLFYNPPTNGVAGQGRINLEVIQPNPAIKQARMTHRCGKPSVASFSKPTATSVFVCFGSHLVSISTNP